LFEEHAGLSGPGRIIAAMRLPRDYYVRLDSIDLSLDLGVIGRRVEVVASPDRVRARHQTLTDPRALGRRPGAALRVAAGGVAPVRAGGADPLPGRLRRRTRPGRGLA
jgi:hypothetical protein